MSNLYNSNFLNFRFLIPIILIGCNSQIQINCNDGLDKDGVFFFNEQPFNGKCVVYFENNPKQLKEIRSFKKGLMHGNWVQYYENGNIFYDSYAKNGEIHGKYKSYHINGYMADQGKIRYGYKNGVWEYFDINGKLYKKELHRNKIKIDEELFN